MKKVLSVFLLAMAGISLSMAVNTKDTRFLRQPAIHGDKIAFVYAEDLWTAGADGANPRRLTVDEGIESNPHFSPDGSLIAFSAEYDGNTDVFVVPATGGIPKRLTYHPGNDMVRGFTPEGEVLFISQRTVHTRRYAQFYKVSVNGSFPEKLIIPWGNRGSFAPDGRQMAYTPGREVFWQWKGYRGGTVSRIWLFSFDDYDVEEIPKPESGANDTYPVWTGTDVYFTSDRNGEFNLFRYSTDERNIEQLTDFKDFPVIYASGDGNKIILEQAGFLHLYNIQTNELKKITVGIATDLQELRPRFVSGSKYIRTAAVSPSANRAVVDFRGDIITVPKENGDPRNITQTQGVHEQFPVWSPDGKSIAYFSDASGEYALHIAPEDGKGNIKKITLNGAGFYAHPRWSPNNEYIAFKDNSRSVYVANVNNGEVTKIDQDEMYTPGVYRDMIGDWSKNSEWLVYTRKLKSNFTQVYLYSLNTGNRYPVTDGLSHASSPVFDPGGRYLFFFSSTDAGPVINWFAQSSQDMEMTSGIYLATLQKDEPSPFAPKSDEENAEEEKDSGDFTIELDQLLNRIVDVPVSAGEYTGLTAGNDGWIFYLNRSDGHIHGYNIEKQEKKTLMSARDFILSADKKNMLYRQGSGWYIVNAGENADAAKKLKTDAIQLKIDPANEWPNIFEEAWRINRDYFYDPGMHGADWEAIKKKYAVFLPDLSCRNDLNTLIQWMGSELGVGHHRVSNRGDHLQEVKNVPGGLLGADYTIENGRYKFKKIYGGLNWTPGLTAPLIQPAINLAEGEYLLAVDGHELTADMNLFSLFEHKAGKIVEITVSPDTHMTNARTIKVTPINAEYALRNRYWVEDNLKKVHAATEGKVAYVYVPNTASAGHAYFKRYFFPQADKDAIIVDERYNGGGQIADYYIDLLMRPYQSYWNFRYGDDLKTPSASIQGPKVMIIDENAGSGGDMLPWMFRKFDVGTLVGKRTWGGLVGVLGFPSFIDGGSVTAPNVAIWTKDGFIVENVGVPPDIEVEQWPKDIIQGRDPQLEKAIEVALKKLEENPPYKPQRPPYPKRANQ